MSDDLTHVQKLIRGRATSQGLRVSTAGPNPAQPYLMVGHPDDGDGTYIQIVAFVNTLTWKWNHQAFVGVGRTKSPRRVSLREARALIDSLGGKS